MRHCACAGLSQARPLAWCQQQLDAMAQPHPATRRSPEALYRCSSRPSLAGAKAGPGTPASTGPRVAWPFNIGPDELLAPGFALQGGPGRWCPAGACRPPLLANDDHCAQDVATSADYAVSTFALSTSAEKRRGPANLMDF